MERRLAKKLESHQLAFKNEIKTWVMNNDGVLDKSEVGKFLTFVYDFPNLTISKEDFQKRKRVKNTVPQFERCTAKRANGEQCTRRKKDGQCFCGTHIKGTPHGIIDDTNESVQEIKKVEVWVQEIKGINYYIDENKNVYLPEDIISNSNKPRVIGTWEMNDEKEYSIPNLEEYN
jgi:hypothetical protein